MDNDITGETLGVTMDRNLNFKDMIGEIGKAGYYKLSKLKNMRHILETSLKLTLVKCYILSKIDCCNFLFCQLPMYQLKRLQNS